VSPVHPFREEPIRCQACGREAVVVVRTDGTQSGVLDPEPEGIHCRFCEEREQARLQATWEVRFPGPGPRSPLNEPARDLVRQIERHVADAADPTLPPNVRAAAVAMLSGALPVTLPKVRTMKAAAAKRSASARSTNAKKKARSANEEKRIRSLILQAERDEDGKRRGNRKIKADLEGVGLTVGRERIQALRLLKK
jgi:hypothetical protein